MKRFAFGMCALLGVATVCTVPQLFSQDTKTAPKTEVKKDDAKAEPKGRLPNNYGKLDLSEKQVTTIYGIQAKYGPEIEKLEAQIEAIKVKQAGEVKAVLTAAQSAKLAELEAAAKKKADDKKAETAKPDATKAEPAKTDATKKPEPKAVNKT